MGIVSESHCPKSIDGISTDHEPNWLNDFSQFHQPCTKTTFNDEEERDSHICTCDKLYFSDESDEFEHELDQYMMNKMGLAESTQYEVINNHETDIKEEDIMNQVSVFETEIMNEIETSDSAIAALVEKYSENHRDVERELAQEKAMIERVGVVGSWAKTSNVKAVDIALMLDKHRLKKLKELEAMNQELKSRLRYLKEEQ